MLLSCLQICKILKIDFYKCYSVRCFNQTFSNLYIPFIYIKVCSFVQKKSLQSAIQQIIIKLMNVQFQMTLQTAANDKALRLVFQQLTSVQYLTFQLYSHSQKLLVFTAADHKPFLCSSCPTFLLFFSLIITFFHFLFVFFSFVYKDYVTYWSKNCFDLFIRESMYSFKYSAECCKRYKLRRLTKQCFLIISQITIFISISFIFYKVFQVIWKTDIYGTLEFFLLFWINFFESLRSFKRILC